MSEFQYITTVEQYASGMYIDRCTDKKHIMTY